MINVRHLRAFDAVARHLHFTKAAEAVFLTQPALSALIRQLEASLGVQLIQRSTRNVQLTEIGREFHQSIQKVLLDLDNSITSIKDYRAVRRGRVRIGALPSLCASSLPRIMREFQTLHPEITLSLQDILGEEILSGLRARSIDIGLSYSLPAPDIAMQPLFHDRLMLVCRQDATLAKGGDSVRWTRLRDQPLIAMAAGTTIRSLIEGVAAMHKIKLSIAVEPRLMWTAIACVDAGLGVAILPSSGVGGYLPVSLRTLRLVDPVIRREINVLASSQFSMTPAVAAFRDLLISELGSVTD